MMFYGGGSPQKFDIPGENVSHAVKAVERANKRLLKAGITDQFKINVTPYEKLVHIKGVPTMVDRATVTLDRPTISYGGYTFLARVEEAAPGKFVAMTAPGVELNGFRPTSMECEHCNKSRARTKVYVIADACGTKKVVGGSCVELYTGLAPSMLWALEWDSLSTYHDDDWESKPITSGQRVYDGDEVVRFAYALIARDGYRNTSSYQSTRDDVVEELNKTAKNQVDAAALKAVDHPDKIRATVRKELAGSTSDWADNVLSVLDAEWVKAAHLGVLVSGVAQAVKADSRTKNNEQFTNDHFIPKGGTIRDMKGEVVEVRETVNYFSPPQMLSNVTIRTEDGYRVFWQTSSKKVPAVGDVIRFDARVKSLNEYKGMKSTKVNYLKWYIAAI